MNEPVVGEKVLGVCCVCGAPVRWGEAIVYGPQLGPTMSLYCSRMACLASALGLPL